jgi:hypothetical protein
MELDLRHTLCPTCDQLIHKSFSINDIILDTSSYLNKFIQSWWKKVEIVTKVSYKRFSTWILKKWKDIKATSSSVKLKPSEVDKWKSEPPPVETKQHKKIITEL